MRRPYSAIPFALAMLVGCDASHPVCEDSCSLANDGQCDDGAPGSYSGFCELGTDCADCGSRGGGGGMRGRGGGCEMLHEAEVVLPGDLVADVAGVYPCCASTCLSAGEGILEDEDERYVLHDDGTGVHHHPGRVNVSGGSTDPYTQTFRWGFGVLDPGTCEEIETDETSSGWDIQVIYYYYDAPGDGDPGAPVDLLLQGGIVRNADRTRVQFTPRLVPITAFESAATCPH